MRDWRLGAVVLAGALAAWTGARAAGAPPPSEVNWISQPAPADYGAALAAQQAVRAPGRAVMQCSVGDDGALIGCRATFDSPAGGGYGKALLSLAPKYKRKPPGKDGLRTVNVVFDWHPFDVAPDWLRRPTPEALRAVYPKVAFTQGIGGRALINCTLTAQGALIDCVPLEETPAGSGFAGAAIALTPQFLMRPAQLKGAPTTSVIVMPIAWQPSGGPTSTVGSKNVVSPDLPWAEAPSYADVAAAYPKKARDEKLAGRAILVCDMSEEGRLYSCETATIEPKGYGFDTAAKALARQFRFNVATDADKKATHSISIHLPVAFDPAMLESTPPRIGKPRWAGLPSSDALQSTFAALGISGTARVVIECTVQPGGTVAGCKVASEDPVGKGLGSAALTLAPTFRLTTWSTEGLPTVGGSIRIPLRYEGDAAPAAPAK